MRPAQATAEAHLTPRDLETASDHEYSLLSPRLVLDALVLGVVITGTDGDVAQGHRHGDGELIDLEGL
jgi:hypothetical protein